MIIHDETAIYCVMTRTALDGFPLGDIEKERRKEFELSRSDRFRYRTRYFTDSGVIGSKEFVSKTYMRFKHHFNSKNEKKPKPVMGLDGMYSLKRLAEVF